MFEMKTNFGPLRLGFGPWGESNTPRSPATRGCRSRSHLSIRMGWLALSVGLPGLSRGVEVREPVRHHLS